MPPFRQEPGTESFDPINDLEPVGEPLVKPQYAAKDDSVDEKGNFVARIVWRNVVLMIVLHATAMYGAMLCFTSAKWQTVVCAFIFYQLSGLGITAGAHRLWAHRSYKARLPLRVFLAFLQTMAFQNHIFEWARDHRVHHKYSETDADPHNARRGFFFAHVGWLLVKKHPEVIRKGKTISMEDLLQDPVVRVQMKYYLPLVGVVCFLLPTYLPNMLWGETLWNGFFVCALFRYAFTLNMTWCVNSAAHFWGRHPYDNNIYPAENAFTILGAIGEGFHNYHHVFPWDYAASELGWRYNLSTAFINTMAVLGQAYELKQVSPDMIRKRKERTGDVHVLGDYGLYHPGDKFVETVDKDN